MVRSPRRIFLSILAVGAALVGLGLPTSPVSADTFEGCPTSAEEFSGQIITPPTEAGTPITDLIGCEAAYSASELTTSVIVQFGDLVTDVGGLFPDDACTATGLTFTVTGSPISSGIAAWAFNSVTNTRIPLASGQDAIVLLYGIPAGFEDVITDPADPLVIYSPIDQPESGSYPVTATLDPSGISLADLAAGGLRVVLVGTDGSDVVDEVVASVTIDGSTCGDGDGGVVTPVHTG